MDVVKEREHNKATFYKKALCTLLTKKSNMPYGKATQLSHNIREQTTDKNGFIINKDFLEMVDRLCLEFSLPFRSEDVIKLGNEYIEIQYPHLLKTRKELETTREILKLSVEVKDLLLLKDRRKATEIIVVFIQKKYIIKSTRGDDYCEMWIYRDGIYLPEAKTYIQEIVRKILSKNHTTHLLNEIINKIQADTYVEKDDFFNGQNKHPYLIPVQNGVLNIYNRELKNFSPNIAFFNKLEMNYYPDSECPNILKFIEDVLPKERIDLLNTIQELFGYCLLKEYRFEKSFMLEGKGRNGKGKLLSLLQRLVGYKNTTSVSLQSLENEDSFVISKLHNKLINVSGDLSKQAIENTGRFKELTGRDTITANRKFKDHIEFVNYAKMIFSSNELPPVSDLSDGFWLRWILVPFPYQFLPQKEIDVIPIEEREFIKLQDPEIIDKIINESELEGLLVWSLDGLKRLSKNKDFSFNERMNDVKNNWLRKSNSVAAFIQDCIIEDYDSKIVKQEFKRDYINYCRKYKLKPLSDKVIKITLENSTSATTNKVRCNVEDLTGKEFQWVWDGIKFRDL